MTIYLIFLGVMLLLRAAHVKGEQGARFLLLFLFVLLALRSWDMGLYDTVGNYRTFLAFQGKPLAYALHNSYYPVEPVMSLIMWLFSNVLRSFPLFVALSSGVFIYGVRQTICRYSCSPYLSVLIFFSMYFFYGMFLIKQCLAMSLILLAMPLLEKRRYLSWSAVVLFAVLVHKFTIVMLLFFAGHWLIRRMRHPWILSLVALVFIGLVPQQLLRLIVRYDPTHLIDLYMRSRIYTTGGGRINFAILFYLVLVIAACRLRGRGSAREQEDYDRSLAMVFLASIFSSFSAFIPEFYRVAMFFGIFSVLLIPQVLRRVRPGGGKRVLIVALTLFLSAYGLGRTAVNTNALPYRTVFADRTEEFQ